MSGNNYLRSMTADEYEAAFHGIDLPATAELFPGTTVTDVPAFIESSLLLLRTVKNARQNDMTKYRLDRLLEMIRQAGA
ncbi:MAG: hypothetical protein V4594_08415 [Bacteroidota bacterium]